MAVGEGPAGSLVVLFFPFKMLSRMPSTDLLESNKFCEVQGVLTSIPPQDPFKHGPFQPPVTSTLNLSRTQYRKIWTSTRPIHRYDEVPPFPFLFWYVVFLEGVCDWCDHCTLSDTSSTSFCSIGCCGFCRLYSMMARFFGVWTWENWNNCRIWTRLSEGYFLQPQSLQLLCFLCVPQRHFSLEYLSSL